MDPRRLLPALTAVACACVAATLVVVLVGTFGGSGRDDPARPAAARPLLSGRY